MLAENQFHQESNFVAETSYVLLIYDTKNVYEIELFCIQEE